MPILTAVAVPHPPIILPEVGQGEEQRINKTIKSYQKVMRHIAELRPDTIVLTSPHSVIYSDYFHISPGTYAVGSFAQFRAPQVRIEANYDSIFVEALSRNCKAMGIPAGTLGENSRELDHATMIPLRFLQDYYGDFKLVRIGLSGLSPADHYRFGKEIAKTSDQLGRRVCFIASGDLSHKLLDEGPYGYVQEGPEFDKQITRCLADADFLSMLSMDIDLCESAAECGLRSFWIMAGALDQKSVKSELLSYEGPFGVGYGVACFDVTGDDESRNFDEQYETERRRILDEKKDAEDEYVKLARLSLETYVKTGSQIRMPAGLPEDLKYRKAGAFVSLKINGKLRGCIGTISPTEPSLAMEIICNAVSAASRDPRFDPVTEDELDGITYSVDVLSEAEPISDISQLDVRRYGVIVESGGRRGLLLPDLSGVDTPEEQVSIARRKAGIREDEPVTLKRFEVVRHL